MFHYIKGKLAMKFNGGVVIETCGIGYEVQVPENSEVYLKTEGDDIMLFTVMAVKEDFVRIYGFTEREALDVFNKLTTVSGVGEKAAMAILSAMPLNEVKQAIVFEDAMILTRANGIGKKTAERIVLELKDKFGAEDASTVMFGAEDAAYSDLDSVDKRTEAIKGLLALGYSRSEAVNTVAAVKDEKLTAEEYIKQALKSLF